MEAPQFTSASVNPQTTIPRLGRTLDRKTLAVLTTVTVFAVGNVYYSQPLLERIAQTFGRSAAQTGLIPTLTQLGYVAGLLFLTPLGDALEKRRLLVTFLLAAGLSLLGSALAPGFVLFCVSSFIVGLTAVQAQIVIPYVASLSAPGERGKNLGIVLSAALIGVLLSRTISGFIGGLLGWRAMYYTGSALMLVLALLVRVFLPESDRPEKLPYGKLVRSLWELFRDLPELRRVAINGAMMYAALSAFWASLAFFVEGPAYRLGPQAVGAFGLIGTVGAMSANLVGRHADRLGPRRVVSICIVGMLAAFAVLAAFGSSMVGLIAGVVILDLSAQSATVSNQMQIYSLHGQAQTRLNTIYKMLYFIGGACGSFLSTYSWQHFGWSGVCAAASAFLVFAIIANRASPPKRG